MLSSSPRALYISDLYLDSDSEEEEEVDESKAIVNLFNSCRILVCTINYWVTQKLPQIYTANHATFPIRIRKITVQICGNF